jgi:mRNA interferase RelE/StbE
VLAYELRIRPAARRDLERLSPMLLDRIEARIRTLLEQPRPVGTEKLTALDAYRARVGDHRIVYEIDDASRTLTIVRVRHRREVYRKLR